VAVGGVGGGGEAVGPVVDGADAQQQAAGCASAASMEAASPGPAGNAAGPRSRARAPRVIA
jgi:hypothetical protein